MPTGYRSPVSTIRVVGKIAYVSLSRGYEAVIDAADVPLVEGRRWNVHICEGERLYASTGGRSGVRMHRLILGAEAGVMVDHIDNDGLNNRRSNIRLCSHVQNMANRCMQRGNRVGFKGVYPYKGRYRSEIASDNRRFFLGTYASAEEAAAAYIGAARVLNGEYAKRESKR